MTKDTGIFALCGYCVRCITASEVKAAFVDVPPNPMCSQFYCNIYLTCMRVILTTCDWGFILHKKSLTLFITAACCSLSSQSHVQKSSSNLCKYIRF